ncbi:MAG: hypothetical protein DMF62_01320 [Acidobacteria bacterium]|nr:MAG: hypothetical protein DMF62_01320 [Acidobacteriota bacterium]
MFNILDKYSLFFLLLLIHNCGNHPSRHFGKTMLRHGHLLQGRYRVLRELGQGGMGAVYEATDEKFGTPVALKEIIFEPADSQQRSYLAAAFEREAKSLATARHECIPFVRDYFQEKDHEYLVMELVEGEDLGHLLDQNRKPFSIAQGIDWMRQLLDALDYLHNLEPQIIHRDIKPQNLKVSGRGRLKLLDFGIAKSGDRTMVTTRKQTFIGATLDYSPIEQIMRVIDATFREFILLKHEEKANAILAQMTDSRVDIFSLGGTFYHLLTYHVPEDATRRTLAVWEGNADPLPHPTDIRPEIPRLLGDFLLKAMSIDRDDRFETADEMLDELNRIEKVISAPVVTEGDIAVSSTQAKTYRLLDEQMFHHEPSNSFDNVRPNTIEPVLPETDWALVNNTDPEPIEIEAASPLNWDLNDATGSEQSVRTDSITDWTPVNNVVVDESDLSTVYDTKWVPPNLTQPAMPGEAFDEAIDGRERTDDKKTVFEARSSFETSDEPVFASSVSSDNSGIYRMIIPVAAGVGLMAIVVIGFAIWIGASSGGGASTISNEPIRQSVPPANVAPPADTTSAPVVEPTPDVFRFPDQNSPKKVEDTRAETQRTSKPIPKEPTAKPKPKSSRDLNCIYTNSCK